MKLTITVLNNNEIRAAILRTAVRKLVSGSWFNITIVREMATLTDFDLTEKMEAGLRLLHCVKWEEIEPIALQWAGELITEICQK
jgi:hypothetical protein